MSDCDQCNDTGLHTFTAGLPKPELGVCLGCDAPVRAVWALRVLDAWADFWQTDTPTPERQLNETFAVKWYCSFDGIVEERERVALTRNKARLLAAQAIWREFPFISAQIGECP